MNTREKLQRLRRGLKDNHGRSIVEMLMVFSLLVVFGIACFSMIFAASNAYSNITETQLKESRARVALNFLSGKVRQNDVEQAVEIKEYLGNDALLLESYSDEGVRVVQWIFYANGILYECLLSAGDQPPEDLSVVTRIAEIEGFNVQYDAKHNAVHIELVFDAERQKRVDSMVTLRSAYRAKEE